MRRLLQIAIVLAAGKAVAGTPSDQVLPVTKDGYVQAGFDVLGSFDFVAPEIASGPVPAAAMKAAMKQVPERVRALDGAKVMVTGYMLPLKMNGRKVTEFLLVSSPQLCCFGVVPKMNDWVIVQMVDQGAEILMDSPVPFYGRLHVHEIAQEGVMSGIYLLDGERMGDGS